MFIIIGQARNLAQEELASDKPQIRHAGIFLEFIAACLKREYTVLKCLSCKIISQTGEANASKQTSSQGNKKWRFKCCIKVRRLIMPSHCRGTDPEGREGPIQFTNCMWSTEVVPIAHALSVDIVTCRSHDHVDLTSS